MVSVSYNVCVKGYLILTALNLLLLEIELKKSTIGYHLWSCSLSLDIGFSEYSQLYKPSNIYLFLLGENQKQFESRNFQCYLSPFSAYNIKTYMTGYYFKFYISLLEKNLEKFVIRNHFQFQWQVSFSLPFSYLIIGYFQPLFSYIRFDWSPLVHTSYPCIITHTISPLSQILISSFISRLEYLSTPN